MCTSPCCVVAAVAFVAGVAAVRLLLLVDAATGAAVAALFAVAIAVGGPGATFWIIVAGIFGMTTKFVECTLGVKYRKISPTGEVSGGPMYYLSAGLAKRGWQRSGKVLAIIFAIMCVGGTLGGGNMVQANQAFDMVKTTIPGSEEYAL